MPDAASLIDGARLAWEIGVGCIAAGTFLYSRAVRRAVREEELKRGKELAEFKLERAEERAADAGRAHALELRLNTAEATLRSLPTQEVMLKLGDELDGVRASVASIDGSLDEIKPAVRMINEYLLKSATGAGR